MNAAKSQIVARTREAQARYDRLYHAVCGETGDANRHKQVCAVMTMLEQKEKP